MSTLLFVLTWVLLGLGPAVIALSGGPGGARRAADVHRPRRAARRAVLFVIALRRLGVGVPAAVIAAVVEQRQHPRGQRDRSHGGRGARARAVRARCAICHTLKASNAIAEIGPNLDKLRPNKALVLDAIEKGRANGNGQMAATSTPARTPRTSRLRRQGRRPDRQ